MRARRATVRLLLAGVVVALAAASAPAVAAPAGDMKAKAREPVHLVLHLWAESGVDILGYNQLVAEFEKKKKTITVDIIYDEGQLAHDAAIMQHLANGDAWADVVATEVRTLEGSLLVEPDKWTDLTGYVGGLRRDYVAQRWGGSRTYDGKQLALPVDLPTTAMCYRRDLFQAAGLPVDRASVAALWPTWDDFIDVGVQYREATGKAFIDSVRPTFESVAYQQPGPLFYDSTNALVVTGSQTISTAWGVSVAMSQAGISANVPPWTSTWFPGQQDGAFAAMVCPSWLLGAFETNAPAEAGQWDITPLPGGAAGYWGGTWLAVPATSAHPAEAAALAAFLTNRKSGLATVTNVISDLFLPTNLDALDSPKIQNRKSSYFANAPVGRIFTQYAHDPKTVYLGPKFGLMFNAMTDQLGNVESGASTPEDAWAAAIAAVTVLAS